MQSERVSGWMSVWAGAGEAWARGEDESAIEHHHMKRYLTPAPARPATKQVRSLSTAFAAKTLC